MKRYQDIRDKAASEWVQGRTEVDTWDAFKAGADWEHERTRPLVNAVIGSLSEVADAHLEYDEEYMPQISREEVMEIMEKEGVDVSNWK
jgi:hypothetical protein